MIVVIERGKFFLVTTAECLIICSKSFSDHNMHTNDCISKKISIAHLKKI